MNDLHATLRQALSSGPALRLVILFGSRARDTARPDSDLDIAILPHDPDLALSAEHALASELERVTGLPVDLVRIDRAPAALRWRIARDGIVLLSEPAHEASRFLARTGIEHDELRALEHEAMCRFRARLAASSPETP